MVNRIPAEVDGRSPAVRLLTKRQTECLRAIVDFRLANFRSPTYEELAAVMGVKSKSTVHDRVMMLESKGYVRTACDRSWNSIEVLRIT